MILYTIRTCGGLVKCAHALLNWSTTSNQPSQCIPDALSGGPNTLLTCPICRVILRHGKNKGSMTSEVWIARGAEW